MEKLFTFEKLDIYQRSIDYIDSVSEITNKYPKSELYGLVSQIRRSSNSIALNIAEGFGRFHKKDKIKFYLYARASAFECIPILTISKRRKYIDNDEYTSLYKQCYDISKMISGLINSVENRGDRIL